MGNYQAKQPTQQTELELKSNFTEYCKKAAHILKEADILLVATGAGFSADSGLAVYKDVARFPAYEKRQLNYYDLCQIHWISEDPSTFYGFWGACFNDYRATTPHDGYTILKSWRDKYFSHSDLWTEAFKNHSADLTKAISTTKQTVLTENDVKDLPGPFFVITSNVDYHSQKSGFKRSEVHQIHGTTNTWQCSIPCCRKLWEAPEDFNFTIDKYTMLAPIPEGFKNSEPSEKKARSGFQTGYPVCIEPSCTALARPAVLMFNDLLWIYDELESDIYGSWSNTVHDLLKSNKHVKLAIIEIGCGNTVPTIRHKTHTYLDHESWKHQATLIRINPEFPLSDSTEHSDNVIPIMSTGLNGLREIDKFLTELYEISSKEAKQQKEDQNLDDKI